MDKIAKYPRLKIWLKIAGGVLIAFLAALSIALPIIVKDKLTDWLKQHGGQQTVKVESVIFNPLLLRLTIHVRLIGQPDHKNHRQNASISIGLLHLWKGRLMINNLDLHDAIVLIEHAESGEWSVGGIRFKTGQLTANNGAKKRKKQSLQIGFRDIDFANVKIVYKGPELAQQVVIDSAHLDEFESWRKDRSSHFFLNSSLAGGTLSFKGEIFPQGKQRRLISTEIAADSVAVGWLSKLFRSSGIESFAGTLTMALKIQGTIGSFPRHAADSAAVFGGEGTLSLSHVNARLASPSLSVALQSATCRGRFAIEPAPLRIDGNLTITSPVIHTADSQTMLAGASALNATGIALDGVSKMSIASVRIDNVAAAESDLIPNSIGSSPYVLTIKKILLNGMAIINGNQFHLNKATIEKANATIMLDSSGDLACPTIPPIAFAKSPGTFGIDTFLLDTTSSLLFLDRSVLPETYIPISALGLSIFDFESSHLSKPCSIFLAGNIGPYSSLRFNGQITSLDSGGSGSARVRLDQLSLPLFSGYMIKNYRCRVKSGSLSMDLNGTLNRGRVKAKDILHFRALKIEPVSKFRRAFKLPLLGSMSLSSLIDIISRHNGDLDMTIKITGDLKNPKVNIFSEVLKKSITNGFLGAIRRIFSAIGRILFAPFRHRMHFKPVEFVSGSDSLSPDNKEYLDSLAVKIKAHERVRIHLCGKATPEDLQVIAGIPEGKKPPKSDSISNNDKQRLFHLALARAFAVKNYLAGVKGVDPEQLFLCDPELDLSGHAKPRVEFST